MYSFWFFYAIASFFYFSVGFTYFAYILYSNNHNRFYKGHFQNPEERLRQHNNGFTKSTKPFIPWEAVYFEEFQHREEAINRGRIYRVPTLEFNHYKKFSASVK